MVTRRTLVASGVAGLLGSVGCLSSSVPDVTVSNASGASRDVALEVQGVRTTERTVTVPVDDPVKFPTLLPDTARATLRVSADNGVAGTYHTNGVDESHGIYVTVRRDRVQFELSVL